MLWLLASENPSGEVKGTSAKLSFRLRMNEKDFNDALNPLVNSGFFECKKSASTALATCYPNAMPETETETETETEGETYLGNRAKARRNTKTTIPDNWNPSKKDCEYAASKGWTPEKINLQAEAFRDRQLKVGAQYADWAAAWRTWVQNEPKFSRNGNGHGNGHATGPATGIARGFAEAIRRREQAELQREENRRTSDVAPIVLLERK